MSKWKSLKGKIHDFNIRAKRKLFFQDDLLISMLFRDDKGVKSIDRIWRLAEGMKFRGIKYIGRDPEKGWLILKTQQGTYLATNERFGTLFEVFCQGCYDADDKYFAQPFVMFDFGLNRAYSTLFFAQHPSCQKIFGYEPDRETFEFAKYNVALNPHLSSKIEIYSYGLGATDATANLFKNADRDSISTIDLAQNKYLGKKDIAAMHVESVTIKKSSNEVKNRLNEVKSRLKMVGENKIILKIDVEGAEYEIFNDLCESGMIAVFDLIIGKAHNGLQPIVTQLSATHSIAHATESDAIAGFIFEKKNSW
jgi:FkbM family methyltransferase